MRALVLALLVPAQIGIANTWSQLASNLRRTCGLQSDGTMWCWGNDQDGTLGDGQAWRTRPTLVP
jgi:alpha-tubulin suppressor-like RCC1 family protein